MKRLAVGILAHVDSGKTTLSEAMLYRAGLLRKLGRVDHKDAFLDTDQLEKSRGITIFSKQALLTLPETQLTLLDTPGHVDFSAEAERAMQVMDYAILVISGTDGIQSHTETLWKLLDRYRVPVFIFVNKMDLAGADRLSCLAQLRRRFGDGCVDVSDPGAAEDLALCSEELLEAVSSGAAPTDGQIASAVAARQLFPCFFGSALKLQGIDEFLEGLRLFTLPIPERPDFGAKIFKITRAQDGARLTWLKVTGGCLKVKDKLVSRPDARVSWQGKADQLRLYSGAKFNLIGSAPAGTVCAVTGLEDTYPGEGLGFEADAAAPVLEPVISYRVVLPEGCDRTAALRQLREIEQEDPTLRIVWDGHLGDARLQLMGDVQLEVLQDILSRRFGLKVEFDQGGILYKETISLQVEGVGHYEPLRHYAEVHLIMEPGEAGSGVQISSDCREDSLGANWQRLIMTHLAEKTHLGVLTGSPLTDIKITLVSGRAHPKHTEGGDFRQATYRAVRQGLRTAQAMGGCVLLEPWYDFTLRLPQESLGRALSDMPRLGAQFQPPEADGESMVIAGRAPVFSIQGYAREVAGYTKGQGQLTCIPAGYAPCHNADEVIEDMGYDPDADTDNSADSIFCSHGAGVLVKWDQVPQMMHLPSLLQQEARRERSLEDAPDNAPRSPAEAYLRQVAADKELMAIFERTYGPLRREGNRAMHSPRRPQSQPSQSKRTKPRPAGPEYVLVDGYNVIFSWEDLSALAKSNMESARRRLMDRLCNYAGYRRCTLILVFDAYKVKGGERSIEKYHNIYVVYTQEAETADMYIERTTHEIARDHYTRVVTSDTTEQIIILGSGALRVSSPAFQEEVESVEQEIRDILTDY